jgi:hypothetical protein
MAGVEETHDVLEDRVPYPTYLAVHYVNLNVVPKSRRTTVFIRF